MIKKTASHRAGKKIEENNSGAGAFGALDAFVLRNIKETFRSPWTAIFGMFLPAAALLLIAAINGDARFNGVQLEAAKLIPGILVFSLSFIVLFSAVLVSEDRAGAFLSRLSVSPLKLLRLMAGYALPMFPVAVLLTAACCFAAFVFGFQIGVSVLLSFVALLPAVFFFAGLGLLLGSLLDVRHSAGISLFIIAASSVLSGTWFEPSVFSESLGLICDMLPFSYCVAAARGAAAGNFQAVWPPLLCVTGFGAAAFAAAGLVLRRRMRS